MEIHEKLLSFKHEIVIKSLNRFFDFLQIYKNFEAKNRLIIAPTRRIDEIETGMPFEEIY